MKLNNKTDIFTGLAVSILGVLIFIWTTKIEKAPLGLSPADYPRIIAFGFIITGIILCIQSIISNEEIKKKYNKINIMKIALLLIICYVYIWLVKYVGFVSLTPILLFVSMLIFGYKKITISIFISITLTIIINLVFAIFLKVPLPKFSLF